MQCADATKSSRTNRNRQADKTISMKRPCTTPKCFRFLFKNKLGRSLLSLSGEGSPKLRCHHWISGMHQQNTERWSFTRKALFIWREGREIPGTSPSPCLIHWRHTCSLAREANLEGNWGSGKARVILANGDWRSNWLKAWLAGKVRIRHLSKMPMLAYKEGHRRVRIKTGMKDF